ncbi:MAG: DUF3570 domain-containing protein [Gammaproteobacteria bacterium]
MQLKKSRGAKSSALMAASCALLGATAVRGQAAPESSDDWLVDSAVLYYKEDQGRVQAIEPVVNLTRDFGEERILGLKITYDSLSGGSPNGAIPSRNAQTFATPSGASLQAASGEPVTYTTSSGKVVAQLEKVTLYTTPAGQLPLDPSFHDQRVAVRGNWQQRLGDAMRLSVGGDLSHEYDFMSVGVNGTLARDFNNKNTTLSFGGNWEQDAVRPVGGAPVGGTDYTQLQKTGNESKNLGGVLFGLTQVMNRRWLAQLNFSYDRSTGYQNDPYKILSVVNAGGDTVGYRFENRPDGRSRQSVFLENKVAVGRDVLDFSMRLMKDDWGIRSRTADLRYRWELGNGKYLEPQARYYKQTAADFYNVFVNENSMPAQFMSADPRLGSFDAMTYGVKFGMPLADKSELSIRIEQYRQSARDLPPAFGQLQGLDLVPGLKSVMLQVGWRFSF